MVWRRGQLIPRNHGHTEQWDVRAQERGSKQGTTVPTIVHPFHHSLSLVLTASALHARLAFSGFWVTIPKETYKRIVSGVSYSPPACSWSQGRISSLLPCSTNYCRFPSPLGSTSGVLGDFPAASKFFGPCPNQAMFALLPNCNLN